MKSWKTTLFGVMGIIVAAWQFVATPMLDGNPATGADFTQFTAAASVGFGLLFARDANVTSEQQGIKKTE